MARERERAAAHADTWERRVGELDLLSWNVHGPPFAPRRSARLAAVAGEIERRAPEVALLQEVWFAADAAALGRRLAGRYRMVDGAPRSGPMRVGGLLAFVRHGAAWQPAGDPVRFERYVACAGRWRVWEGDGLIGKGVQVLSLVDGDGGHPVTILHTHIQAQYNAVAHRRPRAAQLAQLATLAAGFAPTTPVLAAGDFNTGPEESLYRDLLAPTWLDLTAATRATRPGSQTQFECGAEPLWIDYILARRNPSWTVEADLELVENSARDEPFSDHNGLHARLRLRRA